MVLSNKTYEELAENFDVVFYPFFLDGVAGVSDLNQLDGIHPTGEGVAEIVRRIKPYVKELISRIEIVRYLKVINEKESHRA